MNKICGGNHQRLKQSTLNLSHVPISHEPWEPTQPFADLFQDRFGFFSSKPECRIGREGDLRMVLPQTRFLLVNGYGHATTGNMKSMA
jgi:hypothetical protein